jgi:hypothetical protein
VADLEVGAVPPEGRLVKILSDQPGNAYDFLSLRSLYSGVWYYGATETPLTSFVLHEIRSDRTEELFGFGGSAGLSAGRNGPPSQRGLGRAEETKVDSTPAI